MTTDTQLLYRRVENIEYTITQIEELLKQLVDENNKEKKLNNFTRFN